MGYDYKIWQMKLKSNLLIMTEQMGKCFNKLTFTGYLGNYFRL